MKHRTDSNAMASFVARILEDYPSLLRGYMAMMAYEGYFDLELESSPGTIAGIFRVDGNYAEAERVCEELIAAFRARGVLITHFDEEWEEWQDDEKLPEVHPEIPKSRPRAEGENDRDYVLKNMESCLWFLDRATAEGRRLYTLILGNRK